MRAELAADLGLPAGCLVHCGVHDSNAALLAARAHPELGADFTLVSTGTWFICARSGGGFDGYDPAKDMLAGVDVAGEPTPMARFMGGRDYETAMGEALGAAWPIPRAWRRRKAAPMAVRSGLEGDTRGADLARRTSQCLGLLDAEARS